MGMLFSKLWALFGNEGKFIIDIFAIIMCKIKFEIKSMTISVSRAQDSNSRAGQCGEDDYFVSVPHERSCPDESNNRVECRGSYLEEYPLSHVGFGRPTKSETILVYLFH